MKRVICLAVAAAGAVLASVGCGSHRAVPVAGSDSATATATPFAVQAPVAAPASPSASTGRGPAANPSVPPAAVRTNAAAAGPAASTATAGATPQTACGQDTLRSSIQSLATDFASGVSRVEVYNCVDDFARLYATGTGSQPAGDQFFLQYTAGRWQMLARGAGIDCGDNNPKLVQACAVFEAHPSH
jgi:hypothetical protein